jgi:DNA-binding CsgD family transcriptional regulator
MYFHLTTRIGELGGMVLSNQELAVREDINERQIKKNLQASIEKISISRQVD